MSDTKEDTWVNTSTGEVRTRKPENTKQTDKDFKKMWPKEIAEAASEMSGSEMRIMLWMMATCDKRGFVLGTFRGLAESYGCSDSVMSSAIASLKYANIIRSAGTRLHMLNPDYIFQGGYSVRQKARIDYRNLPSKKAGVTDEKPSLPRDPHRAGPDKPLPAKIRARQQSALQKLGGKGIRGAIPDGSYRQRVAKKLTNKDP